MLRRPIDRLRVQLAVFAGLTLLVGTGATDTVDATILGWLLPLRSPGPDQLFQAITLLGDPVADAILALALATVLVAREGRRGLAALLLFAGFAVEFALKQLVFQPGPPSELVRDSVLLPGLRELSPFTYPGGHALRVTFLAALLAARVPALRIPLAVVVALVAAGRMYLATGWAADVAGGVLFGLVLATIAEVLGERSAATGRAPLSAPVAR